MKRKITALFLSIALSSFILIGCDKSGNSNDTQDSTNSIPSISDSGNGNQSSGEDIINPNDYYGTISNNLEGTQLRSALYDLMMKTHKTYVSYSGLRDVYGDSDRDPNHSGNVFMFYTNTSRPFNKDFTGTINREHVWPNSKGVGKSGPGSDAHHLRPCDSQLNGQRGNLDFDEVPNGTYCSENGVQTKNKKNSSAFEPQDEAKGQVARIIFYVGTHYGPESSYGLTILDQVNLEKGTSIGKLSTLLKWNLEFPVDDIEKLRNEEVYDVQGNRNPFIDHPEYACKIWKDYNDATRNICK